MGEGVTSALDTRWHKLILDVFVELSLDKLFCSSNFTLVQWCLLH